ncbi:MAG: hypothetical protein EA398_15910 [Deltaproteobacteria bacterium]|nr:MAG: hypothetical protein EA398_15910 [Deltaproteobacteria bacterium]
MNSLSWQTRRVSLPFRTPFRFGDRTIERRDSVLLRVCFDDGCAGEGEAAPLPGFIDAPTGAIEAACALLLGHAVRNPALRTRDRAVFGGPVGLLAAVERAWDSARHDAAGLASSGALRLARAAIETALADAAARSEGVPLARWLAPGAASEVALNGTLGRGSAAARLDAAHALRDEGFHTLKVKLAAGSGLAAEAAALQRIADDCPGIVLRFDLNRTLPERSIRELDTLLGLPVQYVEEPVVGDAAALARAARRCAVPLAADESLLEEPTPDSALLQAGLAFLVLKPNFLGGPLSTLRRARLAMAAGCQCTVTTALDSAVGRAMALHVAAALEGEGGGSGAHGLATARFLASDVAAGPLPAAGRLAVPALPGLGLDHAVPGCRS